MLNAGQPGFVNSPVTKTIIASVILATVFGSIIESQSRLTLHMDSVIEGKQVWRLLTHNFVFTTPGELLFGIVLLYFFRQFERQLGSSRYAAFALVTSTLYTAVLAGLQVAQPLLMPASGPYALIFACVVHFFFETPKVYHFQVLGALDLSDKTFAYMLAVQLVFSAPPRSLLSCAAALLAGVVCRVPIVRDHMDMPEALVAFCSTYVLPLLGTQPRPSSSRRSRSTPHARAAQAAAADGGVDGEASAQGERELQEAQEAQMLQSPSPPPVSGEHISTLVAMGFSRDQATIALHRAHDDVQVATEVLLQSTDNT